MLPGLDLLLKLYQVVGAEAQPVQIHTIEYMYQIEDFMMLGCLTFCQDINLACLIKAINYNQTNKALLLAEIGSLHKVAKY